MVLAAVMLCAGQAVAQDSSPVMTVDGLEQIETSQVQGLYWQPGASLASYSRIKILDCFVAFRKNWERDQNVGRLGTGRVDAADMERIKDVLAGEFLDVFTNELQANGGYEIVDVAADDVLLLRPAIINLDVTAPDLLTAGRSSSFVASAGSMTLYLELYDSATNALIGRVVDSRSATRTGAFRISNSVTNRAEADRILRRWATLLRGALDERWSGSH
jgi:hypothetical protein